MREGFSLYGLLRPLLFRLNPELSHRLTIALMSSGAHRLLRDRYDPPQLHTRLWGMEFRNPLGLAAGADKDARAVRGWEALGFGFAELGTITPRPQPGNPAPRIWRLENQRALINRLGFPSAGMAAARVRMERVQGIGLSMRVGLNFGPNKETPADRVVDDYAALMARLGAMADFVVVNISSPNTAGLREWQAPERIRAIVDTLHAAPFVGPARPPLLIKIAPDLEDSMVEQVCVTAIELRLDGIVATNTTVARDEIGVTSAYPGGLSGEPLKARARAVIAACRAHTRGRIPIIGAGGIASAEDAYDVIRAGASLIELYTAMIYHGPGVVGSIKRGLVRLLTRDGFRSISEAVGNVADR
ncbi:MAG: quinone-dependent dihydroorotate dehydrogenase [Candidatus Binataceae bacterium]